MEIRESTHVTGYVPGCPRGLERESIYRQLVALSTKIVPRLLVFCLKWEHTYILKKKICESMNKDCMPFHLRHGVL